MVFKFDLRTPRGCDDCHFSKLITDDRCECFALHFTIKTERDKRPDFCPIIPLDDTEERNHSDG